MKKLILTIVGFLLAGSLFAQTERTEFYVKQLIASGVITGKVEIVGNSNATVAFTTDSCLNIIHSNLGASAGVERDLPASERDLVVAFLAEEAYAITIDPNGTDYIIISGVSAGAGDTIESDGTLGRYIVLLGLGGGAWMALPAAGWADSNP
jgi:hypothetical protein